MGVELLPLVGGGCELGGERGGGALEAREAEAPGEEPAQEPPRTPRSAAVLFDFGALDSLEAEPAGAAQEGDAVAGSAPQEATPVAAAAGGGGAVGVLGDAPSAEAFRAEEPPEAESPTAEPPPALGPGQPLVPSSAEAEQRPVLGAVAPLVGHTAAAPQEGQRPTNAYVVEYTQVPVRTAPAHHAEVIGTLWRGDSAVCEASVVADGEEWLEVQVQTLSHDCEPSQSGTDGVACLREVASERAEPESRLGYVPRRHRLFGMLLRPADEHGDAGDAADAEEEAARSVDAQTIAPSQGHRLRTRSAVSAPEWALDAAAATNGAARAEEDLRKAASWLASADAVLVTSGSGMAADSAVAADWRQQLSYWLESREAAGASFEDFCSARLFGRDPQLAWAFWLHCGRAYRESRPHKGYDTVLSWARRVPLGGFCLTSSVDGHWMMAGWPADKVVELSGTVHWLQCSAPCCDEVWAAPAPTPSSLAASEDSEVRRAADDLPRCPRCGEVARPCLRMHSEDRGFVRSILDGQRERFSRWLSPLEKKGGSQLERSASFVILELGCSPGSELRSQFEPSVGSRCRLIRVNPRNPGTKAALGPHSVSVPLGPPEALERLSKLWDGLEMRSFICVDAEGNGAEVMAPAGACVGHVYRKAVAALAEEGGRVGVELGEPGFAALHVHHVHQKQHSSVVRPGDRVPQELFFVRARHGGEEAPVVFINVSRVIFQRRNAALQARVDRAVALTSDLIREFEKADYQRSISQTEDAKIIQENIRAVHLKVLPKHGFPVIKANPSKTAEMVVQMQGFIQSGCLTPDMVQLMSRSVELSGYDRAQELTAKQHRQARARTEAVRKAAKAAKPGVPTGGFGRALQGGHAMPHCVVVFMRHGQREDYLALGDGRGAEWVAQTDRPWDPPLAEVGRKQTKAAAARLRDELATLGFPFPSHIYTSPLIRCVETGDIMAREFSVRNLLVEEGLMEAICEAWMRQWAVPGANANWGGPPHAPMPEAATHRYEPTVQGPDVLQGLRPEAERGLKSLLRTPQELAILGGVAARVSPRHVSAVSMREMSYRWGQFEPRHCVALRVLDTVIMRAAQNPGRTLLFVSHGGPTQFGFEALTQQLIPHGSGGMCALSILQRRPEAGGIWEALLVNDASHAKPLHKGAGG